MAQELTVAAVQMYCNRSGAENLAAAEEWIRQAAGFANMAASIAVTRKGAQKYIPLRSEVDALSSL